MTVPNEFKYFVTIMGIHQAELKQEEDQAIGTAVDASSKDDREVIKRFIDGLVERSSDPEILAVWNACSPTYGYEPTSYLRILLAKISSKISAFKG